jgi:DUF438 domain-containing protein
VLGTIRASQPKGKIMDAILHVMMADHRRCDELLAQTEEAVARADLGAAQGTFAAFAQLTLEHFACEEKQLFPAFEERSGMRFGPTEMMRQEHFQMRELIIVANEALVAGNLDTYCGEMETLLILMQQHNMKEENILYPMCDRHLGSEGAVFAAELQQQLHGKPVIA